MPQAKRREKTASSRFVRSVHIESDVVMDDALDGFVLTATGRGIL